MAFPTIYSQNVLTVQRFANALYNMQVGSATLNQVLSDSAAVGGLDEAFNIYFNFTHGAQSNAMVAETLLANFGIVAGQNGLDAVEVGYARDYIVGALAAVPADERGAAISDLTVAWAGLATDATYGAAAAAWNAEVAVATSYTGPADLTAGTSVPAHAEFLTVNNDVAYGTEGNDTFTANVEQVNGAQANTLGSGDYAYGFGGNDTLVAEVTEGVFLGGGNQPIQPKTLSVENIVLEAQFSNIGFETLDMNIGSLLHDGLDLASLLLPPNVDLDDLLDAIDIVNDTSVYVNAADMDGVDFIGSDGSDADLTIMDLTTVKDGLIRLTSAMTVGMAYTGNSDHVWNESDLKVYFDEDYLLAGKTITESQAFYWLLDEDGHDATVGTPNYEPLQRIDREGILFSLNGVPINIIIGELTGNDYTTAKTWEDYRDLLEEERAALVAEAATDPAYAKYAALSTVDISVSYAADNITTTNTDTLLDVPVAAIILTDNAGGVFSDLGYQRDPGATGEFDVFGRFGFDPSEDVDLLISVNVELEKVGRGGDGGELVIGGMNKDADNEWGDGSSTKPAGVEQFDVTVLGGELLPNSLASLKSTNNALQVVNVVSDNLGQEGYASLEIGNSNTVGGLDIMAFNYDSALKDVRLFDASAFMGDLTLFAGITDESIAKHFDLQDIDAEFGDDNVLFSYMSGAGDDSINLQIDTDVSAYEDAEFSIETNAGDDVVVLALMNGVENTGTLARTPRDLGVNWYADQAMLDNLWIDTGADNDVVWTPGSGNVNVFLGSGDDVYYADNTGGMMGAPRTNDYGPYSAFMYNTVDFNPNNNQIDQAETDVNDSYRLYNARVTVEFMGHEVTVNIDNDNNGIVTDQDINQAIIAAVTNGPTSSNPGLSAVLNAFQGAGHSLVIESLIDGEVPAPVITITAPTSLTSAEISMLSTAYGVSNNQAAVLAEMTAAVAAFNAEGDYDARQAYDGDGIPGDPIIGSDSIHNSDNVVEGFTGNDVFVLGTNSENSSNDTLVYNGAGNGYDCVYNFQTTGEIVPPLENLAVVSNIVQGADEVLAVAGTAVAETFTLEVTAAGAAAGAITFDGGTVNITAGMTLAQVVAEFITPDVAYANYTATAGPTASTIIFTETAPLGGVDILDSTHQVDDFIVGNPTLSGVLVATVDGVDGTTVGTVAAAAATFESFIVTFGDSTNDVSYTFDGEEIPVLNLETGVNIASAAAVGDYANWLAFNGPFADYNGDTIQNAGEPSLLANQVAFLAKTAGAKVDVTDASFVGANIQDASTFGLLPGFDMVDFTSYDVTGVYVEGQGWVTGGIVAGQNFIYLDESATNDNEFTMTERKDDGDATLESTLIDVVVTAIGVLDFGDMTGPFAAENFII